MEVFDFNSDDDTRFTCFEIDDTSHKNSIVSTHLYETTSSINVDKSLTSWSVFFEKCDENSPMDFATCSFSDEKSNNPSTSGNRKSLPTEPIASIEVLLNLCCAKKCLHFFSPLVITELASSVLGMGTYKKRAYLEMLTRTSASQLCWNQSTEKNFMVRGQVVCPEGFRMLYSLTHFQISDLIKSCEAGQIEFKFHGNKGTLKTRKSYAVTKAALQLFLDENAQHLPNFNKKIVTTLQTKSEVYHVIKEKVLESGQLAEFMTYRRFMQMWEQNFPEYTVGKVIQ